MDGAELIALQKNRYWETSEGLSLDAGPFVSALEYATGREAEVVGKPSPAFFELALGELGVSADRAAMVGDDVEADVGGAMDAGLAGILVRTGKYREDLVARERDRANGDGGLDRGRARAALDLRKIRSSPPAIAHKCPMRAISGCVRSTTVTAMEDRAADLEAITARLERIAAELEAGPDEERAAELVREASAVRR